MTNLSDPFEQFLKEKQYIDWVIAKTLRTCRDSWRAFNRYRGEMSPAGGKAFVIEATQAGVIPGAMNMPGKGFPAGLP